MRNYGMAISIAVVLFGCTCPKNQKIAAQSLKPSSIDQDTIVYTPYSTVENKYRDFNSSRAINTIAKIENVYFRKYKDSFSPYYGTVWRTQVTPNKYTEYTMALQQKPDSMHCTIYAVKALEAGLGDNFARLEHLHHRQWGQREHAGWSIGYLLVTQMNWKAYLIIDRESKEFAQCLQSFKRAKTYPVWKQPDIPLTDLLIRGEQDQQIQKLLTSNEFGWGFSHQGIHTWITRFDTLKECYWAGAPGAMFEIESASGFDIPPTPLFLKTPFFDYYDYASHVVIFPPTIGK